MKPPARVLSLTKGLGRGGTERLLVGTLRHLDRSRFEMEVAYLLPWKDALVTEIRAQGVVVHCLGGAPHGRAAWLGRLRRLVRSGRFDILHTHMPYPAVFSRLGLWPRPPAIVHTEHNVWERYRWPTYWANALTYGRNAAVVAVSHDVAHSIRSLPLIPGSRMPRVDVVVHGIEPGDARRGPEARGDARALLGIGDERLIVGTVGNFTPKKDQGTLLDAVSRLVPAFPGLQLVMVGAGPMEAELRAEARRLQLGSRVLWAGSRDDVLELLPAFDVFALSSRHEGLSIALLEALASGLPCVATRVGGTPEVIRDGETGLLVPPGDPEALASALGALLDDPARRAELGERAAALGAGFDLALAVDRLEGLYEEVLACR